MRSGVVESGGDGDGLILNAWIRLGIFKLNTDE